MLKRNWLKPVLLLGLLVFLITKLLITSLERRDFSDALFDAAWSNLTRAKDGTEAYVAFSIIPENFHLEFLGYSARRMQDFKLRMTVETKYKFDKLAVDAEYRNGCTPTLLDWERETRDADVAFSLAIDDAVKLEEHGIFNRQMIYDFMGKMFMTQKAWSMADAEFFSDSYNKILEGCRVASR